jgi:hypothetical protein
MGVDMAMNGTDVTPKIPSSREFAEHIIGAIPHGMPIDDLMSALYVVMCEAVARRYPALILQMEACDSLHKQMRKHLEKRADVENALRPVMQRADAEHRTVTKEELEQALAGVSRGLE